MHTHALFSRVMACMYRYEYICVRPLNVLYIDSIASVCISPMCTYTCLHDDLATSVRLIINLPLQMVRRVQIAMTPFSSSSACYQAVALDYIYTSGQLARSSATTMLFCQDAWKWAQSWHESDWVRCWWSEVNIQRSGSDSDGGSRPTMKHTFPLPLFTKMWKDFHD